MSGLRPEDRCRGAAVLAQAPELALDCHRSEGFAEDLPRVISMRVEPAPRRWSVPQRRSSDRTPWFGNVWTVMRGTPAS